MILTKKAEPEIEGITYYYGFEKPPALFVNNAVCDAEVIKWQVIVLDNFQIKH